MLRTTQRLLLASTLAILSFAQMLPWSLLGATDWWTLQCPSWSNSCVTPPKRLQSLKLELRQRRMPQRQQLRVAANHLVRTLPGLPCRRPGLWEERHVQASPYNALGPASSCPAWENTDCKYRTMKMSYRKGRYSNSYLFSQVRRNRKIVSNLKTGVLDSEN